MFLKFYRFDVDFDHAQYPDCFSCNIKDILFSEKRQGFKKKCLLHVKRSIYTFSVMNPSLCEEGGALSANLYTIW